MRADLDQVVDDPPLQFERYNFKQENAKHQQQQKD
jgi:hypothetical protein